ncbi:MAG: lipoyl(octanoyl) transferase LipB [Armatimonadetes bacterium]|nr:lipoyl(octanoyl) transferase LipB [Armatimonadota bacterium]
MLCVNERVLEVIRLPRLSYADGLELQSRIVREVQQKSRADTLLLLEHDPVITLGRAWKPENLLHSKAWFHAQGIEVQETTRGGDVTYHGPGQLVGYPIISLSERGQDVHRYLRDIEAALIQTVESFQLQARAGDDPTGVWVKGRKIAAIGIRVQRWVTSHGFALNVNTDLSAFDLIIACGLKDRQTTSLARETGREVDMETAQDAVTAAFSEVFGAKIQQRPPEELLLTAGSGRASEKER